MIPLNYDKEWGPGTESLAGKGQSPSFFRVLTWTEYILQAKGYQTLQDRNGSEAINIARRERPDLILMDIRLPGISGLEITRMLKDDAELKVIPVIAVTAFSSKMDEEKCLDGGCDGYIAKPIMIAGFLKTLAKFLG